MYTMKDDHEHKPRRLAEPVQVYLDARQRSRLEQLADRLEASKSDVLRLGLEALERQLLDPEQHPLFRLVGIAGAGPGSGPKDDAAREHDLHLADQEAESWRPTRRVKKRGH